MQESLTQESLLKEMLEMLSVGGPVVLILSLMSVIALTIVLSKIWEFYTLKLSDRATFKTVLAHYKNGAYEKALALSENSPNPILQAMHQAMQGRIRKLSEPLIREEIQRYGSDALFQLRKGFRPLEVIASLAPLLGLLGTVLGMIEAFKQLELAGSKVNPAVLSGGIWEALLTTAVGLAVAIPVVALLNWLERRVDQLAHDMENLLTQIFTVELSASSMSCAPENQEVEKASSELPSERQSEADHESSAVA